MEAPGTAHRGSPRACTVGFPPPPTWTWNGCAASAGPSSWTAAAAGRVTGCASAAACTPQAAARSRASSRSS